MIKYRFKSIVKLGLVTLASGFLITANPIQAAEYPDKSVSWIVPFPPGGPTDTSARILADAFSKELGQTFVVENKPGASSTIGLRHTMRSKPDGYTISMIVAHGLTAPYMLPEVPYNLETDIQPIGLAYFTPLILVVNPELLPEVTDIKSYGEAMRGKDGNYTSAGIGSTSHLTMELIRSELGLDTTHIPFQGSGPAVTAVLSGEIPAMMSDPVAVLPHIKAGKLRPIAVNATERLSALEDVPLLSEQGIASVDAISWVGLFAAKDTPEQIINTLNSTLKKAVTNPEIAKRMQQVGAYPIYSTPEEMERLISDDSALWKKVIEENNLKPQ